MDPNLFMGMPHTLLRATWSGSRAKYLLIGCQGFPLLDSASRRLRLSRGPRSPPGPGEAQERPRHRGERSPRGRNGAVGGRQVASDLWSNLVVTIADQRWYGECLSDTGNANAREVQRRVILSRAATGGVQLVLPVPRVAGANLRARRVAHVYPSAIHRARRRVVNDMANWASLPPALG